MVAGSVKNLEEYLFLQHRFRFPRLFSVILSFSRVAVISAKNHKRQRRKRRSVTAKRENSQTPKV